MLAMPRARSSIVGLHMSRGLTVLTSSVCGSSVGVIKY